MTGTEDDRAIARVAEYLPALVARLVAAGVPDEALATIGRGRGLAALSRARRLVPAGRAWRLGVVLLDSAGALYETGDVARAIEPLRAVTNRSASAEARREDRRAAVRGHFPEGEVVNFGHAQLALDAESLARGGRLSVSDGTVMVRWNDGQLGVRPLVDYLEDRARLLLDGAF